jgi:enoyl-CoA hydratase/carnithine racemase
MVKEIRLAIDEADADPGVRVVILTGAGRSFSAGYDIKPREDGRPAADPQGFEIGDYIKLWWDRDAYDTDQFTHFWKLGVPVIASVRGYCFGGGFWYSMACDMTIAAEDAVFGQPEVRHVSNTSFLLAALTNWKQAHRWGLTGDHMGVEEAYRLGIVNKVVPVDKLEEETWTLAERISKVPEASVRINKAVTWMGLEAMGLGAAMKVNAALSSIAHSSHGKDREALLEAQAKGGMRAFLEARDGPFLPEPYGPKSKVK